MPKNLDFDSFSPDLEANYEILEHVAQTICSYASSVIVLSKISNHLIFKTDIISQDCNFINFELSFVLNIIKF